MPILKERQSVGIYSSLIKQHGGGNHGFAGAPIYKSNLTRVQSGSGFFRNHFLKFRKRVGQLGKKLLDTGLAQNIGEEVLQQAKKEIPAILTGQKTVGEAVKETINTRNVIDNVVKGVQKTVQQKRKHEEVEPEDIGPLNKVMKGSGRIPQKSPLKSMVKKKVKRDVFEKLEEGEI